MPPARTRREWLLVAAAALLAVGLWRWRGPERGAGDIVEAPFTLLTADRDQLVCALDHPVHGFRCGLETPERPASPAPPAAQTLAPALTTSRALYLVAGLFAQPALLARVAEEPPEDRPVESLRRFTTRCRLRLLGKADGVRLRWAAAAAWEPPRSLWVAEPVDCRVENH
jgi:hypothetical protein